MQIKVIDCHNYSITTLDEDEALQLDLIVQWILFYLIVSTGILYGEVRWILLLPNLFLPRLGLLYYKCIFDNFWDTVYH